MHARGELAGDAVAAICIAGAERVEILRIRTDDLDDVGPPHSFAVVHPAFAPEDDVAMIAAAWHSALKPQGASDRPQIEALVLPPSACDRLFLGTAIRLAPVV